MVDRIQQCSGQSGRRWNAWPVDHPWQLHTGCDGRSEYGTGWRSPNLYDRLVLASENLPAPQSPGTVSLDGILNILLAPGFRPNEGDVFTLISDGLLMGEFAKINGLNVGSGISLIPTYGANSFFLTATATSIPEPSSFLLITCALALTGCVRFHAIRKGVS